MDAQLLWAVFSSSLRPNVLQYQLECTNTVIVLDWFWKWFQQAEENVSSCRTEPTIKAILTAEHYDFQKYNLKRVIWSN